MSEKKSKTKWLLFSLILLAVLGSITFFVTSSGEQETQGPTGQATGDLTAMEEFAQCLTENDATMYGAYWCPHCDSQKQMFGDAVQHIDYVECDAEGENAQPQLCRDKGISGYPTWIIQGEKMTGVQSLESLASATGCQAP